MNSNNRFNWISPWSVSIEYEGCSWGATAHTDDTGNQISVQIECEEVPIEVLGIDSIQFSKGKVVIKDPENILSTGCLKQLQSQLDFEFFKNYSQRYQIKNDEEILDTLVQNEDYFIAYRILTEAIEQRVPYYWCPTREEQKALICKGIGLTEEVETSLRSLKEDCISTTELEKKLNMISPVTEDDK